MNEFQAALPCNKLPLLPPARELVETVSILRQESRAASALAELKGLSRLLPNPAILINALVLKEAKASSEIENIITTDDQLYRALTVISWLSSITSLRVFILFMMAMDVQAGLLMYFISSCMIYWGSPFPT